MTSKLPQAKQFKHWVTSEVLPSIYHKGYYKNEERIKQLETQVEAQHQYIYENSEGIALQKRIDNSEYLYTASEFVKRFNYFNGTNLGRNEMLLILRDRKVLSSSYAHWNEPYQQYCKYATLHTANGCLMFKDAFFAPFAKFYKEWLDNEDARLELVVDTSIVALF